MDDYLSSPLPSAKRGSEEKVFGVDFPQ